MILDEHLDRAAWHCQRRMEGETVCFRWDWRLRVWFGYVNIRNEEVWGAQIECFDEDVNGWARVYGTMLYSADGRHARFLVIDRVMERFYGVSSF